MTTGWLFLSDRNVSPDMGIASKLESACLVMEMAWPAPTGVLLDWQGPDGLAISLFHHPTSGLGLLWRDGGVLRRFLLPSLRTDARLARLLFRWDHRDNSWTMRLDDGLQANVNTTYGLNPPQVSTDALMLMCAGRGISRRDASVLWFGVTEGQTPAQGVSWISPSTPIATVEGLMPAGMLREGQWIMTRDAGPVRLKSLLRMDMPSRGSHAAVVLRAPFHARDRDLLVSSDQLVVVSGLEAEYLFGEDEVLVGAGALVDGRSVLIDNRRATTHGVSLDLGQLHLIDVQGCTLMTAHHGPAATKPLLPLRALEDYEALPLMSLLRRMKSSDAA